MILKAYDNKIYLTKREIYYKNVELFKNQKKVDKIIQYLCLTYKIQRINLNIISESKGLIAGNISFYEGEIFYDLSKFKAENKSKQLTEFTNIISEIKIDAEFILIIEKETVFNSFLFSNY